VEQDLFDSLSSPRPPIDARELLAIQVLRLILSAGARASVLPPIVYTGIVKSWILEQVQKVEVMATVNAFKDVLPAIPTVIAEIVGSYMSSYTWAGVETPTPGPELRLGCG
jgi:hypothetical protein